MPKQELGPLNRGYGNFVYEGPGQRLVATCEPATRTPADWDKTFAYARLFSAAPELLKACETLAGLSLVVPSGPLQEALDLALLAIAKAEGR